MAVADVLDGISGKHADGVDGFGVELGPSLGRTEPEMSVSVALTCQEILSGRRCGLLIGQPRTMRISYRGRVGWGYRVMPGTVVRKDPRKSTW